MARAASRQAGGGAFEQEARVDGDAVSADADAGLVDVGEGLGVGGGDGFGHVDAVLGGDAGELVGEGDVDVAVGGLGELDELGGLAVGDGEDGRVEGLLVEGGGASRAFGVDAADDLGIAAEVGEDAADEDALRAEGEEEVAAQSQARCFEGGARGGCAWCRAGTVVSRMTSVCGWRPAATARAAASRAVKSARLSGVRPTGTTMTTTLLRRTAAVVSTVALRRPAAWAARSFSARPSSSG